MAEIPETEDCKSCGRTVPWAWVPPVFADGKPLAGTGVWQSQVEDGRCVDCDTALKARRRRAHEALLLRVKLEQLLGGPKPYREFLFENYKIKSGNRIAYERCKRFNPETENLYLWGAPRVGKTHLGFATARRCVEQGLSVAILSAYRLSRQARMNDPDIEEASLKEWVCAKVLVLEDLGAETDTPCSLLLQQILDRRDFQDRAGLIATSAYSLDALAEKMGNDSVASRLAAMCEVAKVEGPGFRLTRCGRE